MLANSAATLPKGRALVESYAFARLAGEAEHFGSVTFLLYGLTDRLTIGVKPAFGFSRPANGPSSRRVGLGDLTLAAQYRLNAPDPEDAMPTVSVALQQVVPTGRHDRLDGRLADGQGAGAYATSLSVYAQNYVWMPNGRIVRTRLNLSYSAPARAEIEGASVYDTPPGFAGRAELGSTVSAGASAEYSLTREIALGLDLAYSRTESTQVVSDGPPATPHRTLGRSSEIVFAPAVEYSWAPNLGVLFAVRIGLANDNADASITPAIAINYVY
ncbi:MAG: transporter [Brevundimonas sp.]|nr:MAG: transporter [Brevundimonas sp.]